MIIIGLITGLVTGILSGLLGIGGGGIFVAAAVTLLGVSQHTAQGAAIAASIPTAIVGVINLHRKGLINYRVALYLAIGVGLGGMCGAYAANLIPGPVLRKIFAVFFALMSAQMFWTSLKKGKHEASRSEAGR